MSGRRRTTAATASEDSTGAADEYEVIVAHTWDDPRTGESTRFQVGDTYTGDDVEGCLAGYPHRYGHSPLIRIKSKS